MNDPLRLLHLIRSVNPVHGGPGEGLRHISTALRALGHANDVLTLDAPHCAWVAGYPARTHALGPARGTYGHAPELQPWLRQHAVGYDALIVHGLWQYHGLATRRAARGLGLPYYVYPHGMLDPWFRRTYPLKHAKKCLYWAAAERAVLRDAAAVLFTTQEESRLAPQSFPLHRARHAVLGYGLALDETAQQAQAVDFLQRFPALQGRRLVLFLARLHAKKGCDLLIEAFAAVAAHDPRLHLVMAGPDSVGLQRGLEQMAQRLGVADRITWTGMLEGRVKWGALRSAEVFVLPSHQENFGIAVAEALAVGLPALVSNQVNIWRELVDAGAGLAEPDTLAGTVALLSRWLALPAPAQATMRAAAMHCYARHFQIDASVQRLVDLVRTDQAHRSAGGAAGLSVQPAIDSQPCHTDAPQ